MANKKYYWLKLKDDFFRDKRIKKLRRIAGGDTYTIIYLKLQLLSLKHNGTLIYEGVEESLEEELALEIDEDEDNVKVALAFLFTNGLIEETDTNHFVMTETIKCIGSESDSAERVRKHREKKKALQCNDVVTISNTEKEKEKETEKKKEDKFNKLDKAFYENDFEIHILSKELIKRGFIEETDLELYRYNELFSEILETYNYSDICKVINYVLSRMKTNTNIDDKFNYFKTSILSNLESLAKRVELANEDNWLNW